MRKWLVVGVGTMILAWIPYLTSPRSSTQGAAPETSALPLAAPTEARPAPAAEHPNVDEAQPPTSEATPSPSQSPQALVEAPPTPTPLAERIASFRRAFETEPRDAFWANDQESDVSSLMEAEEFTGEDIAEIACRRSVCRIVFKEPQPTANRTFTALARLRGHFSDVHFVAHDSASDPPAQLYLLRQGYALDTSRPK